MNNIKILIKSSFFNGNNQWSELEYERFTFSAGEVSVKLKLTPKALWENDVVKFIARIQNSEDLIALFMLKEAIEGAYLECPYSLGVPKIDLVLPYIPYARQDRRCVKGEAFSLKVFCQLVNNANFNSVTVIDPHSNVSTALIDRVKVISQCDVVQKWTDLTYRLQNCILVSPDGGAAKKTGEIAKFLEHKSFVRADKNRDLNNGKIIETIVYCDDFGGKDVAVVDDLVENGGTYLPIAKIVKERNAKKFILFCTHGILPKGADHLFANGVDEIWITTSFRTDFPKLDNLKILEVEKLWS